jgi:uncharacterized Zn finger protein (UPF0148 family)
LRLDEDCECVFHCSECDAVMIKDVINGGHLCPNCDASPDAAEAFDDVLGADDAFREAWASESWRVKREDRP